MNKTLSREIISKRLIFFRTQKKLVQRQVAEHLGIQTASYQSYEEARAEPSVFILKQLSNFYGLNSVDDLVDFSTLMPPSVDKR